MPGHLNCNTEKRLLAHTLKHLHTKTGGEILLLLSFGFMSPITSFSVCVWMRLCVSAGRCVRVPWQSHFMHHKQTDSVSEWKRWLASRLLRKAFTNRMISSSQLWSSQWPMISIPPSDPVSTVQWRQPQRWSNEILHNTWKSNVDFSTVIHFGYVLSAI